MTRACPVRGVAVRVLAFTTLLLLLLTQSVAPARAEELLPPRLQIGINLLPAVIAANRAVISSDPGTELSIYLAYRADRHLAEQLQNRLAQRGAIVQHRLEIIAVQIDDLVGWDLPPNSTIFIVERIDRGLQEMIEYAAQQRALLFSPHQGDVELGVNAGLKVTDKVLPMVNMASLKKSKIQLKAFFLRIAVKHE
jgi:hypothetical protein